MTSTRLSLAAALLIAAGPASCSSSAGSTPAGGSAQGDGGAAGSDGGGGSYSTGDSGSMSAGGSPGASLTVTSARVEGTVGGLSPTSGHFLLVVDLALKNSGAPNPLSTNPVLFSIQTSQSIDVSAFPAAPTNACDASVSVAPGGQATCSAAFQVPNGQTPATLVYDDQRGDKASASLPAVATPSASCETYAGWFRNQPSVACGTCLQDAEGSGAPCESASHAYGSSCGNTCLVMCNPLNAGGDPCSCELSCESASCHTLWNAYVSCLVSTCASQCP